MIVVVVVVVLLFPEPRRGQETRQGAIPTASIACYGLQLARCMGGEQPARQPGGGGSSMRTKMRRRVLRVGQTTNPTGEIKPQSHTTGKPPNDPSTGGCSSQASVGSTAAAGPRSIPSPLPVRCVPLHQTLRTPHLTAVNLLYGCVERENG